MDVYLFCVLDCTMKEGVFFFLKRVCWYLTGAKWENLAPYLFTFHLHSTVWCIHVHTEQEHEQDK